MRKQDKIFLTSNRGIIGSAFARILRERGYSNIISADDKIDLFDGAAVKIFLEKEKPDYVIMTSQKSGSIAANIKSPAEFIYDNLAVQNNIIHNSYLSGVKKLLFIGASCVYPKDSPQPIKEEYLLKGEVEKTSEPYAVAKIAGIVMCRAYNEQHKTKFISVVPATFYGPGDHFDPEKSHVLSGLIRKFFEAAKAGAEEITLWGSGNPRREFIYIDDFVEACLFLMESDTALDLFNIGAGVDFTIKELAERVKILSGFQGKIKWDTSRPDGAMKKLLDSGHLHSLGWQAKINLDDGLQKTFQWFAENYANYETL